MNTLGKLAVWPTYRMSSGPTEAPRETTHNCRRKTIGNIGSCPRAQVIVHSRNVVVPRRPAVLAEPFSRVEAQGSVLVFALDYRCLRSGWLEVPPARELGYLRVAVSTESIFEAVKFDPNRPIPALLWSKGVSCPRFQGQFIIRIPRLHPRLGTLGAESLSSTGCP